MLRTKKFLNDIDFHFKWSKTMKFLLFRIYEIFDSISFSFSYFIVDRIDKIQYRLSLLKLDYMWWKTLKKKRKDIKNLLPKERKIPKYVQNEECQ